jgi:hypothetical protein
VVVIVGPFEFVGGARQAELSQSRGRRNMGVAGVRRTSVPSRPECGQPHPAGTTVAHMAAEHTHAEEPEPSGTRAAPLSRSLASTTGARRILALQRAAGNLAVRRLLRQEAAPAPGPGGGFRMPWQAARAALEIANPKSILSKHPNNRLDAGVEYGGLIYKLGGLYYYTEPLAGSPDRPQVEVWDALGLVPEAARTSVAGDYHTHGGDYAVDELHYGEDFSGYHAAAGPVSQEALEQSDVVGGRLDLQRHRVNMLNPQTYTLFLATPSGRFLLFTPATNVYFGFSPSASLLPPGRDVAPGSYAH